MSHPNHDIIRRNRARLRASRGLLVIGGFLLVLDYYLTFLSSYWNFRVLLWMFIAGCGLVLLAFLGKLLRMRRPGKDFARKGECVGCGACCRLPVRCVFLFRRRCMIHRNRPRQCRDFPSGPEKLVSHDCGYFFKES